jgi:hypothetical protein
VDAQELVVGAVLVAVGDQGRALGAVVAGEFGVGGRNSFTGTHRRPTWREEGRFRQFVEARTLPAVRPADLNRMCRGRPVD